MHVLDHFISYGLSLIYGQDYTPGGGIGMIGGCTITASTASTLAGHPLLVINSASVAWGDVATFSVNTIIGGVVGLAIYFLKERYIKPLIEDKGTAEEVPGDD